MDLELKELTMREVDELFNLYSDGKMSYEEYELRLAYSDLSEHISNCNKYYKKAFENTIKLLRKEK